MVWSVWFDSVWFGLVWFCRVWFVRAWEALTGSKKKCGQTHCSGLLGIFQPRTDSYDESSTQDPDQSQGGGVWINTEGLYCMNIVSD